MQETISQKERIANELKSIAGDVTAEDKMKFVEATGYSITTVSAYLTGKTISIPKGIEMLQYFKARIRDRELLLNKLIADETN